MAAYLAKVKPLLPNVKRVILMGISGGGFGASLNWWRVRKRFGPNVRVDLLDGQRADDGSCRRRALGHDQSCMDVGNAT